MTGLPLIFVFVLAIVLMIVLISRWNVHPFVAIMCIGGHERGSWLRTVSGACVYPADARPYRGGQYAWHWRQPTTAGIVAPLLPVLGLDSPVRAALCCMAIGAGAMTVSHANDSFFWVVTNFGAMSPDRGYKAWTLNTLVLGVAAVVEIFILSLFLR